MLRILATVFVALSVAKGMYVQNGSAGPSAAPQGDKHSESEIRDADIAFFSERAARDPSGAMDLARLGALYLERGRANGDPRDAILAEQVARRSLKNRGNRNVGALQILQSALLSQHRFTEAMPLAIAARDADPDNPAVLAALGEIYMELGQYDSARVAFSKLRYTPGDPAVEPRLARWAELTGDSEKAMRLLRSSMRTIQKSSVTPAEQKAWYWLRIGDVEFRREHFASADSAYLNGLRAHPNDYRVLSALSRSALAQRKYPRAVFLGEKAIAITLDPATLGTLSDAWLAIGDTARSDEYANALDVAVKGQPGAYHRAWSLFLLDHNRRLDVVSRKIREELATRKDIYAYDLFAWSLHRKGREHEAERAMEKALALGTHDPLLTRHASAIQDAVRNANE